ncbi:MAG: ribosome biogenesis GTPase Der [Candidatus Omnitrophota bacterium]
MNETKDEATVHVAIVGKPNVGKSTLFNRLIGKRKSITDARSGTTRDRLYERVKFREKEVFLIDTGGIQYVREESLDNLVDREVNKALVEADVVLFVCEVGGLSSLDYQLVEDLRHRSKNIILVVNKVDTDKHADLLNEFYKLGLGEPIALSASHGRNIDALNERVYSALPPVCFIPHVQYEFNLAIVGEPNSGKSTLLNQLLKQERAVVSQYPGTTRDALEEDFEYAGRRIRLVDTAGIKKKKKMTSTAALFSLFCADRTIQTADIIFLLIDAQRGPQKDTRAIYKKIRDSRKGCIIVVNKWDTVKGLPMDRYKKRLVSECGFLHNTPIMFISALTGRNIDKIMDEALRVWEAYTVSVPTKELNRFLEDVKRGHPPAPTVKFKYMVQVAVKPPLFVLFVKNKRRIDEHYTRFLINSLIDGFSLIGVIPNVKLKEEDKP